jgi:hypothetical protein
MKGFAKKGLAFVLFNFLVLASGCCCTVGEIQAELGIL